MSKKEEKILNKFRKLGWKPASEAELYKLGVSITNFYDLALFKRNPKNPNIIYILSFDKWGPGVYYYYCDIENDHTNRPCVLLGDELKLSCELLRVWGVI